MKLVLFIALTAVLFGANVKERDFSPAHQFLMMVACFVFVYYFGWVN